MPARKTRTSIAAALAAVAILAAGCGAVDVDVDVVLPPDTEGLDTLTGTLRGGGSSFQDTFEQQVLADFIAVVTTSAARSR